MSNSPMASTSPMANQSTPRQKSPDDMDVDIVPKHVQKLHNQDIIPELFAILHDLQVGKLLAKDFDNKLGSIRLRLSNMKQTLRDIPGITETIEARQEKIRLLKVSNQKKAELVDEFTKKLDP